jgi:two-component system, chemotaxis family, response regulator Rcp1
LESLNVFTIQPIIPAPVWAWRSVSELSNGLEVESGWNPSLEGVQRFSLRSQSEDRSETRPVFSILLVEDNSADVGLVREALEEHGVDCELLVIGDGDKAIRFIQALDTEPAVCPDLFIVDLNLPKRPGRDVLQSMRQNAKCKGATVVILSSSDALRDRTEALELGASRYIRKPLRLEEFLALGAVFKQMLEASRNKSR